MLIFHRWHVRGWVPLPEIGHRWLLQAVAAHHLPPPPLHPDPTTGICGWFPLAACHHWHDTSSCWQPLLAAHSFPPLPATNRAIGIYGWSLLAAVAAYKWCPPVSEGTSHSCYLPFCAGAANVNEMHWFFMYQVSATVWKLLSANSG